MVNAGKCGLAWCTTQHNTQHNTTQHNTTQHNGVVMFTSAPVCEEPGTHVLHSPRCQPCPSSVGTKSPCKSYLMMALHESLSIHTDASPCSGGPPPPPLPPLPDPTPREAQAMMSSCYAGAHTPEGLGKDCSQRRHSHACCWGLQQRSRKRRPLTLG